MLATLFGADRILLPEQIRRLDPRDRRRMMALLGLSPAIEGGGGPSQYLQPKILDAVFGGGAAQAAWTGGATWYIGVSTQANSSSVTDASLLSGEPTSAGSYGRIVVTNNATNFPASSGSNPSTKHLHVAFSFAASSAAWSTGATALASFFIADALTLAGGNVLFSGPLTPATDIVNGAGVTFTFAIDALTYTLNQS